MNVIDLANEVVYAYQNVVSYERVPDHPVTASRPLAMRPYCPDCRVLPGMKGCGRRSPGGDTH